MSYRARLARGVRATATPVVFDATFGSPTVPASAQLSDTQSSRWSPGPARRRVRLRIMLNRALVALSLTASAAIAMPAAATAAPPTRIVDHTEQVFCTAVAGDLKIAVAVGRSDIGGTESRAQISSVSTSETIGRGRETSDWGPGTFRATTAVFDNDENPVGEVYFAGGYAVTGEPERTRDQFNAGNVRVVEEHTETVAEVNDVVLRYGDLTFTDPECGGWVADGSLFFTNPQTVVLFGSSLGFDCTGTNVVPGQTSVENTLDELFVSVWFADQPEANALGIVSVGDDGRWQGDLRLQIADEPSGTVAATATLSRSGQPFHRTEGETGMRNHFQVTPYRLAMSIDGPTAPATLDCTLYDVRQRMHLPNEIED